MPFTGEQGWGLRAKCFCGAGWDLLQRAGSARPGAGTWWVPCSGPPWTTYRDLSTHQQRQGHPYLCQEGHSCSGSRGWVAITGVMQ